MFLVWCPPGWCCGRLYPAPDPAAWRCPESGVRCGALAPRLPAAEDATGARVVAAARDEQAALRKARLFEAACHALWRGRGNRTHEPRGIAAAQRQYQCALLRDLFADPSRPCRLDPAWLAWNGGTVAAMARAVYEGRSFDRLPILADALEDAGCADEQILSHCRQGGNHFRGCWVVDLLRGEE